MRQLVVRRPAARLQNDVSKTQVGYGGLVKTAADDEKLVNDWNSNP
jgi:hypothetical protein